MPEGMPFTGSRSTRKVTHSAQFFRRKNNEKNQPHFKNKAGTARYQLRSVTFGEKGGQILEMYPRRAEKLPGYSENSLVNRVPFFKSSKGHETYSAQFFRRKKTKKIRPGSKKDGACNRPLPAPTDLIAKHLLEKKPFCCLARISILFTFWTCGATYSIHRRQCEMHIPKSVRTCNALLQC